MTTPEDEKMRRAAALEALRTEQRPPRSFWQIHGGRIVLVALIVLALLAGVRLVGRFIGTSRDEALRSQEELLRGLRGK